MNALYLCRMEIEIIHDRIPLEPMSPEVFDQFMEKGWRILGYVILRHSAVVYNDEVVITIPLRIKMNGFAFSKSQRKILKTHKADFQYKVQKIALTKEKNDLFLKHCNRFRFGNHYTHLSTFITEDSGDIPVPGYEIEVYDGNKLIACSYFHIGSNSFCGTYCFFDPDYNKHSLGAFTMLLELEIAQQMGKEFYYSGYVHHTPSQFDYKLNFNNLEQMNWGNEEWQPQVRIPLGGL
ncbi:MAG: hypothetical protein RIR11_1053 [Bacteroidota bacterium]|jgi:arginyl-tRNA--protein-N-Asp/Glu arginylyltransferase